MAVTIINADCRTALREIAAASVQTCVTSPPYFGLRDYGHEGQIGLEPSPDEFVAAMVEVFREVRRVLRDDGTLWLNLGDSYAGSRCGPQGLLGQMADRSISSQRQARGQSGSYAARPGAKPKDLIGIPWMVAFALRSDGWFLRSHIIWAKPNPMPESVVDRPTSSHESIFLLAKSSRYFYDAAAIREPATVPTWEDGSRVFGGANKHGANAKHGDRTAGRATAPRKSAPKGSFDGKTKNADQPAFRAVVPERNKRNVWTVPSQPFAEAHFATFPPALIEPCILAGCPEGGTVLDPFGGAGTTGLVADRHGRNAILIELNPAYAAMAEQRIKGDSPLFAVVEGSAA